MKLTQIRSRYCTSLVRDFNKLLIIYTSLSQYTRMWLCGLPSTEKGPIGARMDCNFTEKTFLSEFFPMDQSLLRQCLSTWPIGGFYEQVWKEIARSIDEVGYRFKSEPLWSTRLKLCLPEGQLLSGMCGLDGKVCDTISIGGHNYNACKHTKAYNHPPSRPYDPYNLNFSATLQLNLNLFIRFVCLKNTWK